MDATSIKANARVLAAVAAAIGAVIAVCAAVETIIHPFGAGVHLLVAHT